MRFVFGLLLFTFIVGPGATASAHTDVVRNQTQPAASNFMQIYGNAPAPLGFVRFCEQNPNQCQTKGPESRMELTSEHVQELEDINKYVNAIITPSSDKDLYGVREYWAVPSDRGDCEDYALLKQKLLVERGWPTSTLLLTVVRDDLGDGHAILTVRTHEGDIILDNKVDELRVWNATSYKYIMRQSYLNPKVWISLDPSDAKLPVSIAGTQTLK
ncbi:MAG: transglutaminase-like cysteine peptidase [Hyphomicrobium sp.]